MLITFTSNNTISKVILVSNMKYVINKNNDDICLPKLLTIKQLQSSKMLNIQFENTATGRLLVANASLLPILFLFSSSTVNASELNTDPPMKATDQVTLALMSSIIGYMLREAVVVLAKKLSQK